MFFFKVFYSMVLLSLTTSPFAESAPPQKVAIIGAGLAGLTAAYRLQQKGMEVEVYEARSRVGGRVFSVNLGDQIAELGAQSIIDDGESVHILGLIKELDLELIKNQANRNQSYFNGKELLSIKQLLKDRKWEKESLKNQLSLLAQNAKNMKEVLGGILEKADPLYQVLAIRLAIYEGENLENLSPYYTERLYYLLLSAMTVADKEEEEAFTPLLSIKGGNAQLPEKLAHILRDKIHLNCPLKKIDKKSAKKFDKSFLLTFEDGRETATDILILTIPCPTYEEIVFAEGVLPLKTLENIKSVQSGTNSKIMIPFKALNKGLRFNSEDTGCFFDPSTHLLTLHHTGSASQFSADTIEAVYKEDRPMMEIVFGDLCPSFVCPVVAQDEAFGIYEGPIGYSWPNDRYAKGSYAYIAPGQEALLTAIKEEEGEKVKALFAPIDQKLYFAGEHTSTLFEASGTMEAACESGEKVARMILKSQIE